MKKGIFTILSFCFLFSSNFATAQFNKTEVVYQGAGNESLISLFFLDSNVGFAGGSVGFPPSLTSLIVKTTDGGDTWQKVNSSGIQGSVAYLEFVNANTGFATTFQPHSLWKTTDGGKTWTDVSPLQNVNGFYDLHFVSATKGFLMVMKVMNMKPASILMETTNGGANWTAVDTFDGFTYIFDWADATHSAAIDLRFMRFTTDAWQTVDSFPVTQALDVAYVHPDTMFFIEFPNKFSRSYNGGSQVTAKGSITGNTDPVRYLAFANSKYGVAVGEVGEVYSTANSGDSWTKLSYNSVNNLEDVVVLDQKTAFAVSSKTSSGSPEDGRIVKIYDSTGTGTGIAGLPGQQQLQVSPNPFTSDVRISYTTTLKSAQAKLYDATGRVVMDKPLNGNATTISAPALPTGIYYLHIYEAGQLMARQKLVKQ